MYIEKVQTSFNSTMMSITVTVYRHDASQQRIESDDTRNKKDSVYIPCFWNIGIVFLSRN